MEQHHSIMADHEESESETKADNDDAQYVTPVKLVAIMLTINLSTMVAALDLVRRWMGRTPHVYDQNKNVDPTHSGHRGQSHSCHH
jgi:hypothetical protein